MFPKCHRDFISMSIFRERTATYLAKRSLVTHMNKVNENESARSQLNPDKMCHPPLFTKQMAKFMRHVLQPNTA